MPRLHFTCAYEGTPYRGWQSQSGGQTLQDVIESAFAAILRQPLRIAAAGRTDAGVHAEAQSFHADIPASCRMGVPQWQAALNARLPASIRILDVREAEADFHARFSAHGKIYEYLIETSPVLSPFQAGRVWHRPRGMEASALAAALSVYEGTHDFRRFAARRGNEPSLPPADYYIRTLYSAHLQQEGSLLRLRFHGDGFMYRMVRLLVGGAVHASSGRPGNIDLQEMLSNPMGDKCRYCAPAEGLYLKQVLY